MEKIKGNFITHKFLPILAIIILIFNIFITTTVFGATYDLSDYKNCNLTGGVWAIVCTKEKNEIYLITGERSDFRYLITGKKTNKDGTFYSNGEFFTCEYNGNYWYNSQGGTYVYTFNKGTSKFENRTKYGIGGDCFKCGDCDIIASGVNIVTAGSGSTSFFQQTPVPSKVLINPTIVETIMKALEEMIQTIITNIKTIIPIGLAVLSIGLLILLVKSVILRMT